MFEWPKAEEGQILVSLPFRVFWATSICLAFLIGLLMWLISEGEKHEWKNKLLRLFGLPPSKSGSSPSNSQGMGLPPGELTHKLSRSDKLTINKDGGAVQTWFQRVRSRKRANDPESVRIESRQDQSARSVMQKQPAELVSEKAS